MTWIRKVLVFATKAQMAHDRFETQNLRFKKRDFRFMLLFSYQIINMKTILQLNKLDKRLTFFNFLWFCSGSVQLQSGSVRIKHFPISSNEFHKFVSIFCWNVIAKHLFNVSDNWFRGFKVISHSFFFHFNKHFFFKTLQSLQIKIWKMFIHILLKKCNATLSYFTL